MDWGKTTIIALCCGLASACGPEGITAPDTDSEGESEGTGTGTTGGDASATSPTATNPTAASGSGSATTTATDTGPSVDSSGDTMPPADTGECPPGTEGCPCDVGAACDEGLTCNVDDGTCVGMPACRTIDTDPHDDEATAIGLDELACDEVVELGVIGTIEGPQTDWYTFFGNAAQFCPEQPSAAAAAEVPLEVCVFLECDNGGDVFPLNCGAGSMDATSPDGRAGCCGTDSALVEGYDCTGFGGKDVDVFISIASNEMVCADYSLEYSY